MTAPVFTGHESELARRVAALGWLSRGRDVRLTAELCGETRAWVQALADEVGHPDRQAVGDAYLKAKRQLEDERATIPARPVTPRPAGTVRQALAEHVASYTAHTPLPASPPVAVNLHHVDPSATPSALAATARVDVTREEAQAAALMASNGRLPEPHLHTFVEGRDGVGGYAHCAGCDTTWRSAPCEVCTVTVAAAHIARTGRARHTWHPESPS